MKKKVYCSKQNAKRNRLEHQQIVWQASVSGPLFITSQETCVNRQRPADKPCTILQTSCSWNVCIQWHCKHLFLQKWVRTVPRTISNDFWPITNMHVQQTTVYVCKKSTPAEGKSRGAHSELVSL